MYFSLFYELLTKERFFYFISELKEENEDNKRNW